MPKFPDFHPLKGFDEETLVKLQHSPVDEFGIKSELNVQPRGRQILLPY
jgi:hypothetical protein